MREKWRLPTGKGAHHIALSSDDKYLYVANQHDGTISVIDLATRKKIKDLKTGKLITEIVADGVPHEIQFVPYSVFMPKMKATKDSSNSNQDTVSAAETIFKNTCASCHGNDLKGGAGPNLTKVGGKYSEQEILKINRDGKGMMPSNLLSDGDSGKIAKWLSEKK